MRLLEESLHVPNALQKSNLHMLLMHWQDSKRLLHLFQVQAMRFHQKLPRVYRFLKAHVREVAT